MIPPSSSDDSGRSRLAPTTVTQRRSHRCTEEALLTRPPPFPNSTTPRLPSTPSTLPLSSGACARLQHQPNANGDSIADSGPCPPHLFILHHNKLAPFLSSRQLAVRILKRQEFWPLPPCGRFPRPGDSSFLYRCPVLFSRIAVCLRNPSLDSRRRYR